MESIEKRLLELSKKTINEAIEDKSFTLEDFAVFGDIVNEILSIQYKSLKPYLITWHINKWEYLSEFIYDALEILGYQFIGNMDLSERKYSFDCNDIYYDKLFRYKNIECDYSYHLKIED